MKLKKYLKYSPILLGIIGFAVGLKLNYPYDSIGTMFYERDLLIAYQLAFVLSAIGVFIGIAVYLFQLYPLKRRRR